MCVCDKQMVRTEQMALQPLRLKAFILLEDFPFNTVCQGRPVHRGRVSVRLCLFHSRHVFFSLTCHICVTCWGRFDQQAVIFVLTCTLLPYQSESSHCNDEVLSTF